MKVLIVARFKDKGFAPFVTEQVDALQAQGVEVKLLPVRSNRYLSHLPQLKQAIREFCPDIIHAHYGLCGFFANFQRRVPVVTTYHGSDINDSKALQLSKISIRLSRFNVFVSQRNIDRVRPRKDYALIPCGINVEDFQEISKQEARMRRDMNPSGRYVLFAGAFDNPVKNATLANKAVALLPDVELIELKGYDRAQVAVLLQAVDVLLMTSLSEGSPQVIKEALVCGCPIVSVDVGDVKERVAGVDGCFVVNAEASAIAVALERALCFGARTSGRQAIERDGLTSRQVAEKLLSVYRTVLNCS